MVWLDLAVLLTFVVFGWVRMRGHRWIYFQSEVSQILMLWSEQAEASHSPRWETSKHKMGLWVLN